MLTGSVCIPRGKGIGFVGGGLMARYGGDDCGAGPAFVECVCGVFVYVCVCVDCNQRKYDDKSTSFVLKQGTV